MLCALCDLETTDWYRCRHCLAWVCQRCYASDEDACLRCAYHIDLEEARK